MEHEMSEGENQVGWQSLEHVLNIPHPLFEHTLFVEGYDISSDVYVMTGDYITIVDPGNDYTAFVELFELGFKPADVKHIVLTHGHQEHVAGVFDLFRYPSIRKSRELEIILHEAGPLAFKNAVKEFGCTLTEVQGGETLKLSGFDLEVVHTPGHTADSICLYHPETRTVFTGDTVLPYAMALPDPTAGGRLDFQLFSLRTLLKMEIENLLPGHGRPVAGDGKRVIEGSYAGAIKKIVGLQTSWIDGAMKLAEKGYLNEAQFCCEKELENNPGNLRAMELKASCLNDMGRFGEAMDIFDKICAKKKNHLFAIVGKGYALMGLGRYGESLPYFDRALKLNPNLKDALIYKGMALYLSGRYEEAMDIEDFKAEFVEKFKQELEKKGKPKGEDAEV